MTSGSAHDEIVAEVVWLVRERIGPVASFKTAVVVERLPKTRSGKILRGTMRRIADGEEYSTPATIDEPATLDEMADALRTIGCARRLHCACSRGLTRLRHWLRQKSPGVGSNVGR
jgi:AMP-binding enzyme C-terminal domain